MNILVDCDGVLAPFTEHLITYLNGKGHHRYTLEDFTEYELAKCILPEHRRWLEQAPYDKQFASSMPRYDGAQQFLKDLVAKGHKVCLVTQLWRTDGPWKKARTEWFESLLSSPELRKVEWRFSTADERVTAPADVLIDDRPQTIAKWITIHEGNAQGFLMDRPWNRQWHAENPNGPPGVDEWEWNGKKIGRRVHSYKEILEHL